MPIYEYVCSSCQFKFDRLQPIGQDGADCDRCGQPARRAVSLFAAFSTGEDGALGPMPGMGGCACGGGACACAGG